MSSMTAQNATKERTVHRIGAVTRWLLLAVVALLVLAAGSAIVENANIGERSWQQPAVGSTRNGFSGAPVGSQLYLQAGYEGSGRPAANG